MSPWPSVAVGVTAGFAARLALLRVDYRRYPGYPHGYINHIALGLIAALLGAVLPPALAEHNYAAVTFLALVAQQFRDVRRLERESLTELESSELVPRGAEYIEGVARVFESRNYLVMAVAVASAGACYLVGLRSHNNGLALLVGSVLGAVLITWVALARQGRRVGDIARIEAAPLRFDGPNLYVGEAQIINVGDPGSRTEILEHGLGAMLTPLSLDAAQTLTHPGQRQALLHDAIRVLGVRKDVDTPEFTPLARCHLPTGRLALYLMPRQSDPQRLLAALAATPVLQGARGSASQFRTGE